MRGRVCVVVEDRAGVDGGGGDGGEDKAGRRREKNRKQYQLIF